MPKLVVSIDGVVVKEVQLIKDRTTIGRRPYNDVVIDNLAVSGEHAVIQMVDGHAVVEDLGSTNGTYVNGQVAKKQELTHEDIIEVGKYRLKFFDGDTLTAPASLSGAGLSVPMGMEAAHGAAAGPRVRVLNGSAAGRELPLTKVVTTIGKPGLSVASITRKPHGFDLARVEGERMATVNGVAVDGGPITLKNRDQIDLGGIRLEYLDS
ncbi:MAG: FHA domain-containing protein [Pseudomonadota bacterium]|nr:FHA domain-containing protein [Pseudomonadota bacterium]